MAITNMAERALLGAVPTTTRSTRETVHPTISIVVPTRNEAPNVVPLLTRCQAALAGTPTEVIFADDSDDGTEATILAARRQLAEPSFDVRLIHRPTGERDGGLGGAVMAGIRRARGSWVCVLDGDLQHPPEVIRELIERAVRDKRDIVIASRYCDGGEAGGLAGPMRSAVSRAAGRLAVAAFSESLKGVTDPMSGFFLLRRAAIDPDQLHPDGYKVLLEILVRTPGLRVAEVGFQFDVRHGGESKASPAVGMSYLRHVAKLRASDRAHRGTDFAVVTSRWEMLLRRLRRGRP